MMCNKTLQDPGRLRGFRHLRQNGIGIPSFLAEDRPVPLCHRPGGRDREFRMKLGGNRIFSVTNDLMGVDSRPAKYLSPCRQPGHRLHMCQMRREGGG